MATAAYYQQQRNFGAVGRQQPQYHQPPPPVEKHVLFYSNHCEHSLELLAIIAQKSLRDRFYLVCVERYAQALPAFVTSVPLVFSESQQVLVDDDLFLFINHLGGGRPQQTQQQQVRPPQQQVRPPPQQQEQQPQRQQQLQYRTCAMQEQQEQQQQPADDSDGASLAPFEFRIGDDDYSFIDEGDSDGDGGTDRSREAPVAGNRNYAFLEADPSGGSADAGVRPPEPIDTRRSDKDLTTMLDKYKAERGMD